MVRDPKKPDPVLADLRARSSEGRPITPGSQRSSCPGRITYLSYPALCGASFCTDGLSSPNQSGCLAVVSKWDDVLNSSYLPSAATGSVFAIMAATSLSSNG